MIIEKKNVDSQTQENIATNESQIDSNIVNDSKQSNLYSPISNNGISSFNDESLLNHNNDDVDKIIQDLVSKPSGNFGYDENGYLQMNGNGSDSFDVDQHLETTYLKQNNGNDNFKIEYPLLYDLQHNENKKSCTFEDLFGKEPVIESSCDRNSVGSNDSVCDLKLKLSDNEVEVGDIDQFDDTNNGIDTWMETDFNCNVSGDEFNNEKENIIEINFSDIKSDYSEFNTFVLIFLFINEVYEADMTFEKNSLKFLFKTNEGTFNTGQSFPKDFNCVYSLNLNLKHEIIVDKCSYKIKKKSIEIRLEKASSIIWGTIKDVCIGNPCIRSTSTNIATAGLNTWTPCTQLVKCENNAQANKSVVLFNLDSNEKSNYNSDNIGKFYGYTGLVNLGNTCFMNAVLQCLSNTCPLKNYFLSNQYLDDINPNNPLGTGGLIAKAFAQFLNQLWMGKQSSFGPSRLKSLFGEKVTTFAGFSQHDAQEFLSFFLDAIHEDLNKNENKPKNPITSNDDDDETDELFDNLEGDSMDEEKMNELNTRLIDKANQMWRQYRLFNDSVVTDLFCGQFKSILTCPDCSKKSVMFDPFLYVPLSIPPPKISYQVIFFPRDELTGMCKNITRFTVKLAQNATVNELLNIISQSTKVSTKHMRLIQQQEGNMPPKFMNSNWVLSDYRSLINDMPTSNRRPLLLFELHKDYTEEHYELCIIQRELKHVLDFSMNSTGDYSCSPIGLPFLISVRKSLLTYSYLCSVLCSYARHSVHAYRQVCNESNAKSTLHQNQFKFNVQSFNCDSIDFNLYQSPSLSSVKNMPHLIYYESPILTENDIFTPFILHKPAFNMNLNNEEEITPVMVSTSSDAVASEEAALNFTKESEVTVSTTLVNDTNIVEEDNIEDESNEQLSENQNQDNVPDNERRIEYRNDALLDLGNNTFYIAMDWISSRCFESHVSVKISQVDFNTIQSLNATETNDITLEDCLKSFIEPEVLGPQNCWRCPNCKVLREASKQLSFWRLPPILVIQLKRFRMQNVLFSHDKITHLVNYPIDGLDLSKYLSNAELACSGEEKEKTIYDLYGVVNHKGSPMIGHYTAYARSSDNELGWREFDDCMVEKVDESTVVTPEAYLLFYKCRSEYQPINHQSNN